MGKEKTPQAGAEEKPATEAQLNLIKQLQEELNMPVLPEEYQGRTLNSKEASDCIHLLKETKVRDQALRAANKRVNGFDKITHGLSVKIAFNLFYDKINNICYTEDDFIRDIDKIYKIVVKSRNFTRNRVAEGGQP